jgi:hypothetical protein
MAVCQHLKDITMQVIALNHDPITNSFAAIMRDPNGNEVHVRGSLTLPGTATVDEIKKRALAEVKIILGIAAAVL